MYVHFSTVSTSIYIVNETTIGFYFLIKLWIQKESRRIESNKD